MAKKTTLLLILDGWGHAPADVYPSEKNAMALGKTPYWDQLLQDWPHTLIGTSGKAVGLPEGIMGNSEVGHTNLGAGRVVWQEITRIDNAIEVDGLAGRAPFVQAVEKARDANRNVHFMGLVSDGGVHSIDRHYVALLRLARKLEMPPERVIFHCFLDGRDTPPRSGAGYVRALQEIIDAEGLGRIGVVSGRYWAMDRDKRWDRVKRAYDALVYAKADFTASSALEAVENAYGRDENDEFVSPTVVLDESGEPAGKIESGDQVVFFNFRPDRARQICHSFVTAGFDGFERDEDLKVELTTMTRYESNLNAAVAFPPRDVPNTLGQVVSEAGLTQLRIAETEKYAHVTYFFSGGREEEFEGEDRVLIPSPKVATYDLQPEMSLPEVSKRLAGEIRSGKYDLIVSNFANGDMVGHTGFLEAAVKAVEAVDAALSLVIPAILETGGAAIITADHGNCENMWNFEVDCPHTQHTTTPTLCVLVDPSRKDARLRADGCLGDLAPTIVELTGGLEQPAEMTGESIILSGADADTKKKEEKKMVKVLYVNGEKMDVNQVREEAERLRPQYEEVFTDMPEEEREAQLQEWARENIVERMLVCQAAFRDPEEMPAEKIDKIYGEMMEQHGGEEEFFKRFEVAEEKKPDVRRDIEQGLRVERQIDRIVGAVDDPTDEEVRQYYDENIERFTSPETVRASHIVKHLDPGEESDEALDEINAIHKKLRNNADFFELAGENSDCPDSGGDLGVFPRGQMVQAFEDVAFNLEVGKFSDVFRTEFGYHIAMVTEKTESAPVPFEEVQDTAVKELTEQRHQKAIEEFVDAEKEKATIEEKEEAAEPVEEKAGKTAEAAAEKSTEED